MMDSPDCSEIYKEVVFHSVTKICHLCLVSFIFCLLRVNSSALVRSSVVFRVAFSVCDFFFHTSAPASPGVKPEETNFARVERVMDKREACVCDTLICMCVREGRQLGLASRS